MNRKFTIISVVALFLVLNFVLLAAFQQRQELRSHAAPSTALSFYPPSSFSNPIQAAVGQPFSFELMMAPGNNKISQLRVRIIYQAQTFRSTGNPSTTFVVNTEAFPNIISPPTVDEANGYITFTLGAVPGGIGYETSVGTVTLIPKVVSDANGGVIGFLDYTMATSVQAGDSPTENAIATVNQAYVQVTAQAVPTNVLVTTLPTSKPVVNNPPTALPTFTCLGSCPTEALPEVPTPIIGETTPIVLGQITPGGGGQTIEDPIEEVPTPCVTSSFNSQSNFGSESRSKKNEGLKQVLLEFILQLLNLIAQLFGGGTVAPVAGPVTDEPIVEERPDVPVQPEEPGQPVEPGQPEETIGNPTTNPCP